MHYSEGRVVGSEDCLLLNVYRPSSSKHLLPVIVFIHGSINKTTDPSFYGPEYLMDTKQVILVTLQFRTGVLGFLASADGHSEGNFGLKDQNMALRWVNKNIHYFGGDSSSVTLIGQGTGATHVHLHMMSPRSNGLFQKAVMLSGTALGPLDVAKDIALQLKQFRIFALQANATQINGQLMRENRDIMARLRSVSAETLVQAEANLTNYLPQFSLFPPGVEPPWRDAFITDDPMKIWELGRYQRRPFVSSLLEYEESIFEDLSRDIDPSRMQLFLDRFVYNLTAATGVSRSTTDSILDYYFKGEADTSSFANLYQVSCVVQIGIMYLINISLVRLQFYRDYFSVSPAYKMVVQYLQDEVAATYFPVHLLYFNVTSTLTLNAPRSAGGTPGQGDDLLYLFRIRHIGSLPRTEAAAMRRYIQYMVNFALFGLPDPRNFRKCNVERMTEGRGPGTICDYTIMDRGVPSGVKVSYKNEFNMPAIRFIKSIEEIMAKEVPPPLVLT